MARFEIWNGGRMIYYRADYEDCYCEDLSKKFWTHTGPRWKGDVDIKWYWRWASPYLSNTVKFSWVLTEDRNTSNGLYPGLKIDEELAKNIRDYNTFTQGMVRGEFVYTEERHKERERLSGPLYKRLVFDDFRKNILCGCPLPDPNRTL